MLICTGFCPSCLGIGNVSILFLELIDGGNRDGGGQIILQSQTGVLLSGGVKVSILLHSGLVELGR